MKETAIDTSSRVLTTLPLLFLLAVFFLSLGGWILYDAHKRWKSGVMVGTLAQPLVADRDKNPGLFKFLGSVRAFAGLALVGFGLLQLALVLLYGVGVLLSAVTGVPL